jgi:hypothetical protein
MTEKKTHKKSVNLGDSYVKMYFEGNEIIAMVGK